jgi:predicted TIM-barrel fold metal-dependent hydrolase
MIDVHFHVIPDFYRDAVIAAGKGPSISSGFPAWSGPQALEVMDANGIDAAILSITQPVADLGYPDAAKGRGLARRCNEYMAKLREQQPTRFGGFAALALPDVEGALAEVDYALDTLKLDGIGLLASYGELFLGDARFDPLLQRLDQRGAVAFIHPNYHPSSRALKLGWPAFMVEFLFDTTRAAVNLVFSGALERYPRIRFILAHGGGTLPFTAWRLGQAPGIDPRRLAGWTSARVAANLRRFWYDTALSAGPASLAALREIAAPDRILFGSDWPYVPAEGVRANVAALAESPILDAKGRKALGRGNALALFPRFGGR